MAGKAGIVHLHVGDGPRGLDLVRQALERSEIPAGRLQSHSRQPPQGALRRGARRWYRAGLHHRHHRVSGGRGRGCLAGSRGAGPLSRRRAATRAGDGELRRRRVPSVIRRGGPSGALDVGRPAALGRDAQELLACGQPLERVLPAFTSNPARLLMLPRKGRLAAGADADLVVLDQRVEFGRDGAGPLACAGGGRGAGTFEEPEPSSRR